MRERSKREEISVEPFVEGLWCFLCNKNEGFVRYIDVKICKELTLTLRVDFIFSHCALNFESSLDV